MQNIFSETSEQIKKKKKRERERTEGSKQNHVKKACMRSERNRNIKACFSLIAI